MKKHACLHLRWGVIVGAATIAVGCGGGSGAGSTNNQPAEQESVFGEFTFRAAATNPPATTNSSSVTATGIKGNFSLIRLRDRLTNMDETRIYFRGTLQSDDYEVYSVQSDGSDLIRLTNNPGLDVHPAISPKGDKVAFVSTRDGNHEVYTMFADGSNVVRITNNAAADLDPEWSPDGNKLVIATERFGPDRKLALVDLNTKVVTQLTFGAGVDASPDFSPDGLKIVYESTGNGNAVFNLFTVPAAGGAPAQHHAPVAEHRREPHYSPDGTQISFFISDDLYRTPSQPSQPATLLAENAATPAFGTGWSPDGKFVVTTPDEDGISRIHKYNVPSGIDAGPLLMPGSGTRLFEPTWGPLVVDRTFVTTTGGLFGTKASGFIYTQGGSQGNSNRCVLAFDATTPTSVVLTQQTGLNSDGPNLVFSIDADVLTYLTFANGDTWMPVRLIGNAQLPSANGALASFSSSTGFLTGLIPFNGSRVGQAKPTVTEEGGVTVIRGSFPAVLDATGKNLAPGGAGEVRIAADGSLQIARQ